MNCAATIRCCLCLISCGVGFVIVLQRPAVAQSAANIASGDAATASPIQLVAGEKSPWTTGPLSAGKHPIEVGKFGSGPQNILIVGSLYGNEPESIALLDATCRLVQANAPPKELTILLIRTLNPDGLVDHIHTNARGVELNRNFPSWQFTSIPTRLTGPQPASEVETQCMLGILKQYQPQRIIHVRSGVADRTLVTVNQFWIADKRQPVLPETAQLTYYDGVYKAASLEEFVSLEMRSSVATVTLARKQFPQLQALELLRLATGNLGSPAPAESLAQQQPANQPAATPPQSPPARPGETPAKVVEFLSPPPEYAATSANRQNDEPQEGRYFELPPPPH